MARFLLKSISVPRVFLRMGPHLKHISLPAVTQTAACFGGEREGGQSACGEGLDQVLQR